MQYGLRESGGGTRLSVDRYGNADEVSIDRYQLLIKLV